MRLLGFVNHIAPSPDIEEAIERAFEWGVDAIVAQGTGSDWGPYWLGSGEQVSANQAANVEPYVRAALKHGVPFVFSFGIAGGDVHLESVPARVRRAVRAQRLGAAGRRDPLRGRQGATSVPRWSSGPPVRAVRRRRRASPTR